MCKDVMLALIRRARAGLTDSERKCSNSSNVRRSCEKHCRSSFSASMAVLYHITGQCSQSSRNRGESTNFQASVNQGAIRKLAREYRASTSPVRWLWLGISAAEEPSVCERHGGAR